MPAIASVGTVRKPGRARIGIRAENAVGACLSCAAPILDESALSLLRTCMCAHQTALSGFRGFSNDVDHSVHRIRAPHRPSRPPNHLDAINVFQGDILLIPIDTREVW